MLNVTQNPTQEEDPVKPSPYIFITQVHDHEQQEKSKISCCPCDKQHQNNDDNKFRIDGFLLVFDSAHSRFLAPIACFLVQNTHQYRLPMIMASK
jgi:hypothetical protein